MTGGVQPQLPGQAAPAITSAAPQMSVQGGVSSVFMGSAPQGAASPEELPLSLAEATSQGLRYNLGPVLAAQGARAARAARYIALSALLPNVNAQIRESSEQINLAAMGFPGLPGMHPIIGPFGVTDARGRMSQTLFNWRSVQNTRAASQSVQAADQSSLDARDVVVLVVTNLYLQAVAGASRVEAARAQLATAEAVYNQAADYKREGVVAAIDVLRAQVEFQAQQQRLIYFRNEFEKQKLNLARAIGLPDGQQFRLTDTAPFAPIPPLTPEEAISRALSGRRDYQSALAGLRAAELIRKAAAADRLPSLEFHGDYGTIGQNLGSSHGTYTAAVSLDIPIFQGGRVRGEILEADAQLEQRRAQVADLRERIAHEVRVALLDLHAASEQVEVARGAVALAQQQLAQARDRFAAGVTNNLEVTQAQEAVATADENYITGLYSFNAAKAALGRAVGQAERTIPSLLQGVMP